MHSGGVSSVKQEADSGCLKCHKRSVMKRPRSIKRQLPFRKTATKRSTGLPVPKTVNLEQGIGTGRNPNVHQKSCFNGRRRFETYHDGSRFIAKNGIVCTHITGKENFVVFDVVSNVGGGTATISVDPLRYSGASDCRRCQETKNNERVSFLVVSSKSQIADSE